VRSVPRVVAALRRFCTADPTHLRHTVAEPGREFTPPRPVRIAESKPKPCRIQAAPRRGHRRNKLAAFKRLAVAISPRKRPVLEGCCLSWRRPPGSLPVPTALSGEQKNSGENFAASPADRDFPVRPRMAANAPLEKIAAEGNNCLPTPGSRCRPWDFQHQPTCSTKVQFQASTALVSCAPADRTVRFGLVFRLGAIRTRALAHCWVCCAGPAFLLFRIDRSRFPGLRMWWSPEVEGFASWRLFALLLCWALMGSSGLVSRRAGPIRRRAFETNPLARRPG